MEPETFSVADILADPDATLARARSIAPLVPTELGPMAVRHEAVRSVLRDARMRPSFTRMLVTLGITAGPFYDWMSISPLDMDGERHKRWRQWLLRTFTPQSVDRVRPYLRDQAERLTAELAIDRELEFVAAFARKLPSLGLCELIGVPSEDRAQFTDWADTIGLGFNLIMLPPRIAEVDAALLALLDYTRNLVSTRHADPRDDLVSQLAGAIGDEGVTAEAVHAAVAALVFAGHETTKNQLGWMVAVLATVPDEWDAVARDPSRAKGVVEEVMRFRSAVTTIGRMTLEEIELFGVKHPADSTILGSIWSANRDEKAFASAAAFNSEANRNSAQIAFGQGAHHCLGAALARAELQESLIALTARLHAPLLERGASFLPAFGISGPTQLPVRFRARA